MSINIRKYYKFLIVILIFPGCATTSYSEDAESKSKMNIDIVANSSSQITLEISKYYYATPYSWELETSVLTEGDYPGAYLCKEHGKTHALNSIDTTIYKSGEGRYSATVIYDCI